MSVTFGQEQRIPARRRGTLLKDCPPVCKAAGIGPREIPSSEQMNRLMEQSSYLCRNCSVSSVYPSGFLLSCSASGSPAFPGTLCLLLQSSVFLDTLSSSWVKTTDPARHTLQHSPGADVLFILPCTIVAPWLPTCTHQLKNLYCIWLLETFLSHSRCVLMRWETSTVLKQIKELTLLGWCYWVFPPNQPRGIQGELPEM